MTWENSGPKLQPRAFAKELTPTLYVVTWKGGDYTIKQFGDGTWRIRKRGIDKPLTILTEQFGLGKEEAIDWIERNC